MIKFGPSGTPEDFTQNPAYKGTVDMPKYVEALGLDCFEYSFGKGVRIGEDTARAIGAAFAEKNIEISVHAPYFINFANPEREKIENSFGYVTASLEAARLLGAKRCVFHPGSPLKRDRAEAVADMQKNVAELAEILHRSGLDDFLVCPETMGKQNQLGSVEEVADLCRIDRIFVPCVDFGHVNAREGGSLKAVDDFKRVVDAFGRALDWDRVKNMHVHFSKIEYTDKGEKCHLTMADTVYGPEFEPLAEVMVEYGMTPYIVSESAGTQGADARLMKDIYLKCLGTRAN